MFHESHIHSHYRNHHVDAGPPNGPPDGWDPGPPEAGRGRGHRGGGGHGRPGFGGPGPGFGGPGGGFGPPGRRRRPKGAVREAVLSLLAEGPANGYSLMRQISERTDGTWNPSPGSVYPTLSQLVDEGLIAATGSEKGTDFTLTDTGREHVEANAEAIGQVWAEGSRGAPSHVALRESMQALLSVAQQFRYATDEQRARAGEQLDETRRALHRILAE
jgi:DNA-binding PadR family transcriptional regulator